MNNFKPGGIRHRRDDIGGRPKSDADYSPKKRFDGKPRFDSRGGRDEGRGGNRFNDRGPKEVQLFNATCTTCGKSCEVPFRPDGTKPVLCRDCFATKNASPMGGRERNDRDDRFAPRNSERTVEAHRPHNPPVVQNTDITALTRQFAVLEAKLNEILAIVKPKPVPPTPVVVTEAKVEVVKTTKPAVAKKVAAPKKEVVKKEVVKKEVKKVAAKKAVAKKVAKTAVKKVIKKK